MLKWHPLKVCLKYMNFMLVIFPDSYLQDSLVNKRDRVGSKYSKYVYKRYTDNTYTTEIPSPQSQGYVGPLIKGEVGDIIRVYFRNSIPIPVSMHPHGVRYDKNNEGERLLFEPSHEKTNSLGF